MPPNIIINVKSVRVKYPLFFSDFNETWIISTVFRESVKYQISSKSAKICPLGDELFRVDRETDGRTDLTKLVVAFYNSASAPKKDVL
jgi:hypothetical protein